MKKNDFTKINNSFLLASIFTTIFITILIIASEVNLYLRSLLSQYFFNYWIAKGILSGAVFSISFIFINNLDIFRKKEDEVYFLNYLSFVAIVSFFIILLFNFFR